MPVLLTYTCLVQGSIIHPSKPSDVKKELNELFHETHPTIDATITLSQIRNLKIRLLEVAEAQVLTVVNACCAYPAGPGNFLGRARIRVL